MSSILTTSPLYATAMYNVANTTNTAPSSSPAPPSSACASPATSTDSHDDNAACISPTTMSKLPGLQFAISHRRGDLRLPSLTQPRGGSNFDVANAENVTMNHIHTHHQQPQHSPLYLSMQQCETPHYAPGVPMCPETSPMEKKSSGMETTTDHADKKRKKGTRRGTLNAEAKNVLKAWMFSPEHFAHPYPSEDEKEELAVEAGIEVKQLSNWFTNARKRLWQPVLRQSGVEVKNFLSTGRGGPRGNKLDVPPNLQHLIAQKEAEAEEDDDETPPSSPKASPAESTPVPTAAANLKRSWSEMHSSPAPSSMPAAADEVAPKKKKNAQRKRAKDAKKEDVSAVTQTASQLSQELRLALSGTQTPTVAHSHLAAGFKEIEIMAAASLIGLHHQPFQSVH